MTITEERPTDPNHPLFSRPKSQWQQLQERTAITDEQLSKMPKSPFAPSHYSPVRYFDAYGVSVAVWMIATQYEDGSKGYDDAAVVKLSLRPSFVDPLNNRLVDISERNIPLEDVSRLITVLSAAADWANTLIFDYYQEYDVYESLESIEWEALFERTFNVNWR